MSKLFKLKEWLSIHDAAKHLSNLFGEEVRASDVLMLAIDGHLKISIRCVNSIKVSRGRIVPIESAQRKPMSAKVMAVMEEMATYKNKVPTKYKKPPMVLCGEKINSKEVFETNGTHERINGVFDLLLIGDDRLAVEDRFQLAEAASKVDYLDKYGNPGVGWNFSSFSVLEDSEGNQFGYESSSGDAEYWASSNGDPLPKGTLVVRTRALREFEASMSEAPIVPNKLNVSDNTLVSTIAALLAAWPGGKPPSGKDLEKAASSVGVSVSDDSIRKALRLAHEIAPSLKPA